MKKKFVWALVYSMVLIGFYACGGNTNTDTNTDTNTSNTQNDPRFSQHWSDGYYVNPIYPDNPQTATSVSVSGSGITGSLLLDYSSLDGRWGLWSLTGNMVFLGTTYPATPLTYTFTITTATGTNTATATVDSFMQEFPTNLSVTKDNTGKPVFSWTKVSGSGMYYSVELHNLNVGAHYWNMGNLNMWDAHNMLDASTVVANVTSMPLVSGTTYIYTVSVTSDKGTAIAEGSFIY